MQKILQDWKIIYRDMNIVSKSIIRYGTAFLAALSIFIVYCYWQSVSGENAFLFIMLYSDLLYSIKEYIGSIYILPMMAEIIWMARGKAKK